MIVIVRENQRKVIEVVRKHKPRNGGGSTLAEFTNKDGQGWARAEEWVAEKGHEIRG